MNENLTAMHRVLRDAYVSSENTWRTDDKTMATASEALDAIVEQSEGDVLCGLLALLGPLGATAGMQYKEAIEEYGPLAAMIHSQLLYGLLERLLTLLYVIDERITANEVEKLT